MSEFYKIDERKDEKEVLEDLEEISEKVNDVNLTKSNSRSRQEIYARLVEKGNDGFVVIQNGLLKFMNEKMTEMTGYSEEEVIDKPFLDYISPKVRKKVYEIYARRMSGQEVPDKYETYLLSKEGEDIAVEILGSLIEFGGQMADMAIIRDIRERKLAENAIKESQRTLDTLIKNLPGIAYRCKNDEHWTMEFLSEGCLELTGYSPEDFVDNSTLSYSQLIHPEDREFVWEEVQTSLNENRAFQIVYRIIDALGNEKWVWEKGRGVYSNNKLLALEGFITDITDRKKLEKSLIQLNEILSLINKNLRHDVLNDLSVIRGSIEVYKDNKDERLLDNALNAVDRSVELIRRMKELETLVTAGGGLKPYNLKELIQSVLETKEIEYSLTGNCTVLGDDAFDSVIENLANNAINHGKADKIDVLIEEKGNFCEVRIANNGLNIPEEIKEKLFEEGFSYGERKGSGLGLYIAKKTIERYGGSIEVENNEPNGAVFILTLKKASDYSGIRESLDLPSKIQLEGKLISKRNESESDTANEDVNDIRNIENVEMDLRGLKCPQPILRIHAKSVKLTKGSIIKVIADCPSFERDLNIWSSKTGKTVFECFKEGETYTARIKV